MSPSPEPKAPCTKSEVDELLTRINSKTILVKDMKSVASADFAELRKVYDNAGSTYQCTLRRMAAKQDAGTTMQTIADAVGIHRVSLYKMLSSETQFKATAFWRVCGLVEFLGGEVKIV